MRWPRRRRLDHLADITVRCSRSEMRLVPTAERVDVLGFWLAKAQAQFPGVVVMAVCQMSNHLHLVVRDRSGDLSRFMQYFLGHLGKRINRLDHIRGQVFERRFAEIPIVDDDAVVDRIAYAITNPVEANLVRSHSQWSGLCTFVGRTAWSRRFTIFHQGRYERALAAAERRNGAPEVNREDFYETATLTLGAVAPELADQIAAAVTTREVELQKTQRAVMGMGRVVEADPFTRPRLSSRSKMPLCFASTREARASFVAGWRAFVDWFRAASEAFRGGNLDAAFPPGSFRPATASG